MSDSFKLREERRQVALKSKLFSEEVSRSGTYGSCQKPKEVCLSKGCESENLHASVRKSAVQYFRVRCIPWHSIGHLLCSQSFCVNAWFPFYNRKDLLAAVLRELGYSVQEVLPFESDHYSELRRQGWRLADDSDWSTDRPLSKIDEHYLAFEWVGEKNYLGELRGRNVAGHASRTRGQNFTSADFAVRFRREDDQIQIVLGEWKYTESYRAVGKRVSESGVDRLERIYRHPLETANCQVKLPAGIEPDALFYDPFDQMTRAQLLASAMEREKEMGATVVSTLNIAPRANLELIGQITSSGLKRLGTDIHAVWSALVVPDRFRGCYTEDLLPIQTRNAPSPEWASYLTVRYGGMR